MLTPSQPAIVVVPFFGLAAAVLLWRYPLIAVFALMIAASTIEQFRLHFADSFTDNIGFWRNLSSSGLRGVPVSPAEILMVGGLGMWVVKNLMARSLSVRGSVIFRSYSWYLMAVIFGLVHGIATGGIMNIALWEIRTQFYGIIIYFLGLNLLRTRAQLEAIGWIIILGTGFKGLQGAYRYLVTLGGTFEGNSLLAHDEAFFFPAYYAFVLLLFVFGGSNWQKGIGLLLMPAVMIAEFANNRRTSTALVIICGVALVFMCYTVMKRYRHRIFLGSMVALILGFAYATVFWNSNSTLAQPVQAVKSQIAPSERDERSDLYRQQEDHNLIFGIKQDPLLGRGYGHRMANVTGMMDLTEFTEFLWYMPHNSVLWVWWRLGLIGFVLFWLAMGLVIVRYCFLARVTQDPYLQRWAVFAVIVMMMRLLVGWWDQGIYMYRVTAYAWVIMAVPEILGGSLISAWNTEPEADTQGKTKMDSMSPLARLARKARPI